MLEAEGKLAFHLQIIMHDWPRDSKQNTIDHVLAALKEQREHERKACVKIAADVERRYLRDGSSDGARAALDVQTEIMNRKDST